MILWVGWFGGGLLVRDRRRSTADSRSGGVAGVSGGLAGGRAPLGPDPTHQLPPRMLSMNALYALILSAGISSAVTWLDLWWQFAKQYPPVNHRGHILMVSSLASHWTRPWMFLLAKVVGHVSPVRILNCSG